MFGERLRTARLRKGLSQKDLQSLLDVGVNAISSWETGKNVPEAETVARIANVLSTSTDYLLGLTPDPSSAEGRADELNRDERMVVGLLRQGRIVEAVQWITFSYLPPPEDHS